MCTVRARPDGTGAVVGGDGAAPRAIHALCAGVLACACGEASSGEALDAALLAAPCPGACDDHGAQRPLPLPRPECPDEQPRAGDDCTVRAQLWCGWGEADDAGCRSLLACVAGKWTVPFPFTGLGCVPTLAADCPEQVPQPETACLISLGVPVRCAYGAALTCYCGDLRPSDPGTTSRWACYGPPADPRCPERLPNFGEGCAASGVACDYSPYSDSCYVPIASRRCSAGAWVPRESGVCDL